MGLKKQVYEWSRLARAHTIAASFIVAAIGYITVQPIDLLSGLLLFILVAIIHTSGCILNDYYDYQYDKDDPGKTDRPLVKGSISPLAAMVSGYTIAGVGLVIAFIISFELFVIGLISATLGIYYNANSKENVLSEFAFVGWEVSIVYVGAILAGSWNAFTHLVAIFIAIQAFYQIQEGSLKDINGDEDTLLDRIGVTENEHVGYVTPTWFMVISLSLKSFQVGIAGLVFSTLALSEYYSQTPLSTFYTALNLILGLAILLVAIAFIISFNRCFQKSASRRDVIDYFTKHELFGAVLLLLAVFPIDRTRVAATLVFSVSWVLIVNYLIHSGMFQPDI